MAKRHDGGTGRRALDQDARAPAREADRERDERAPAAAQAEQAVLLGSAGAPAVGGRDSARTAEATRQTGG